MPSKQQHMGVWTCREQQEARRAAHSGSACSSVLASHTQTGLWVAPHLSLCHFSPQSQEMPAVPPSCLPLGSPEELWTGLQVEGIEASPRATPHSVSRLLGLWTGPTECVSVE